MPRSTGRGPAGGLVALLVLSMLLVASCAGGSPSPSASSPAPSPRSSSPAPLGVEAAQHLFLHLLNSCEDKGRAFSAALVSDHNVFGPDVPNERAAAAAYVTTCTRTVDGFLHDRWPIDPFAFQLDARDLQKTVTLMASFAAGDIPDDWLRQLNHAKHKFGRDLGLLEADIGLD